MVHEIGHTFGLLHCVDYQCVMHSSTSVEEIDVKGNNFCTEAGENVMNMQKKLLSVFTTLRRSQLLLHKNRME